MKSEFLSGGGTIMLRKLAMMNVEYFVKESSNILNVAYGDTIYSCAKTNSLNKGLFLFGLVKRDFDKWLNYNPIPKFEEMNYRSFYCKSDISSNEKVCSYDINHAYWRIAFINGYIGENTYNHGLRLKDIDENMKQVYCMALSVQGQTKTLDGFINNKPTGNILEIKKNPDHLLIYNDIRNKTYKIMDELSYILGDDFRNYNVDCITFVLTKKNIKTVKEYLNDKNLTYKRI